MRIALDVMGGDHAPVEILEGAKLALAASDRLSVILVGDQEAILSHWPQAAQEPRVVINHCSALLYEPSFPSL